MSQTDRQQRKHRYESILSCIDYNTTPKQPAGITLNRLCIHLAGECGRYSRREIAKTLRAARQNGDVIKWSGEGDERRFTVAEDVDRLREVGMDV